MISDIQKALSERLKGIQTQKNLKNNEIAAMIGRSEGTVSDLLKGTKAFSDKLIQSVMAKIGDLNQQGELVTSVRQYQQMWSIATACKESSDMRLVVGNTGIGKSVVFRKFTSLHSHVYYFKTDRSYTWTTLLTEIARVMGLRFYSKKGKELKRPSASVLLNAIIQKVEETIEQNPMLIIDESEVLNNSIYKHIKNLYTATEGLLGIVIVGISEVRTRIARISGLDPITWLPVSEDSNQYTTFARRLKIHRLPNIGFDKENKHDIDTYCMAKGITNIEVMKLARSKWWNFDEAERAVKRAVNFGFALSELTVDEFKLL